MGVPLGWVMKPDKLLQRGARLGWKLLLVGQQPVHSRARVGRAAQRRIKRCSGPCAYMLT